eukprot:3360173-Pyramimonas_sp.AAC.1
MTKSLISDGAPLQVTERRTRNPNMCRAHIILANKKMSEIAQTARQSDGSPVSSSQRDQIMSQYTSGFADAPAAEQFTARAAEKAAHLEDPGCRVHRRGHRRRHDPAGSPVPTRRQCGSEDRPSRSFGVASK